MGATITEQNQAGFTPMPGATTCVNKTSGEDVPVPVDYLPDSDVSFTIDGIDLESVITCTVYNRAPDTDTAQVEVHKMWRVETADGVQEYLAGEGAPFSSQLSLSDPSTPGAMTDWGWSDPRTGYSVGADTNVTISERVRIEQPECDLVGADIAPGPPSSGNTGQDMLDTLTAVRPLDAGHNEWTITNTVECRSYLTLAKDLRIPAQLESQIDPDTARAWWDLDASGDAGTLDGPTGPHGSPGVDRIEVSPEQLYALTEQLNTDAHDALHFTLAGWACFRNPATGDGDGFPVQAGDQVAVGLGQSVLCQATNVTSMVTMQKTVQDGNAVPADFVFELAPQGDDPRYHPHQVRGGPPNNIQSLVPDHPYTLTEIAGPDGYELVGPITCATLDGVTVDADALTLLPGEEALCEATNRSVSDLTVRKVDADDGALLAGGEFELWRDENGDGPGDATQTPVPGDMKMGECTTEDSGECRIDGLRVGDYYWFEVAAPPSYVLPDRRFSDVITITAANAGPDGTRPTTVFRDRHATWTVTKASDPVSGSEVQPGQIITYTLKARTLDGVPVHDVRIEDDLDGVLDHAALLRGSLEVSDGSATLDGTRLVWELEVLDGVATATYQVRVDQDAWSRQLANVVTAAPGNGHQPCEERDCDSTEHHTPKQDPGTGPDDAAPDDAAPDDNASLLPDAGGPAFWLLVLGTILLLGGGIGVAARRRPVRAH